MKLTASPTLALAAQLLLLPPLHAADSRDMVTTRLGGETCVKVFKGEEAYQLCDSSALSPEDKATFNAALRANEERRRASLPKADPRTPRYNKCVDDHIEDYYYVSRNCGMELNADLDAAFGNWFHQDERKAVLMQTVKREAEMKRVLDERTKQMEFDRETRRRQMTPTQRRLDELEEKLSAPCIYYDNMSVARSCD